MIMSLTELLRMGREHYRAGRLEEAERFYRRAVELDGANAEARLNLGIVLHELGRLVEATEVLGKLVVDHKHFAAGWVQLARTIEPQGFAWEAHKAIDKALKATPDADTLIIASGILVKLQDLVAAELACRRALKMSPRSAPAWIQLAQILTVKGATTEAAAAFRQALAFEPANPIAAFVLAAGGEGGAPTIAPPEYVRALFDAYADGFDSALVGSLKYQTPQKLDRMFSQWQQRGGGDAPKPMVMLDAGCGTGLCGLWMTRYRGRLIGVDLSRGMIANARLCGIYDELIAGDIVEELDKRPASLDLIVAADVLVYVGDLTRLFTAAAAALRKGGIFLLSVEATTDADFLLLPTQRFAHSIGYLNRLAASNSLKVCVTEEAVLRLEKGAEVGGYLMLTEKT
jgi:predicted TPR repeat methyltransferase